MALSRTPPRAGNFFNERHKSFFLFLFLFCFGGANQSRLWSLGWFENFTVAAASTALESYRTRCYHRVKNGQSTDDLTVTVTAGDKSHGKQVSNSKGDCFYLFISTFKKRYSDAG